MTFPTDDFEWPEDRLRARRSTKWSAYGSHVLPAWIAESDYRMAEPIMRAADLIVEQQDFGYPRREDGSADLIVSRAFCRRMESQFGWRTTSEDVQPVTDLVQAVVAAIMAFSEEGDGIVVQTPCYPPFRDAVATTRRTFIDQPMIKTGERYAPDLDSLDKAAAAGAKILILCNPHNPTGAVFSRDELEAIGAIAAETGMVIVSDEIHSDLVFDGARHLPIASLGSAIAAQVVTITSPTKSFNTPGLRCGVMHFGSAALRAAFHRRIPAKLLGRPSVFGIDAAVAAWDEGQPWLDGQLAHLVALRAKVTAAVATIPGVSMTQGEGTYFTWIDCSGLGLQESAGAYFLREAGIAFSAGETFGPQWRDWIRFNFATSTTLVDAILERLVHAAGAALSRPAQAPVPSGAAAISKIAY